MNQQQTVELALDLQADSRIAASDLLSLSEAEFSDLRRAAMENRVQRNRVPGTQARFVCAICRKPLYLSRYNREDGNRWFAHDGASPDCPWHEGNRLSPEMRRALIYRGQQEGAQHFNVKNLLARWLEDEPCVSEVNCEMVTHGQVLKGEWKRPDVHCRWHGKRVVFEIQLSYTFLSEVIKRDNFYREEGIFIIWLFAALDLRRAVVLDEAFFNRRNLFVLDQSAIDESIRTGRLTFSGTFQAPVLVGKSIEDHWQTRFITLNDVQFPTPSFRPYFFDYEVERLSVEKECAEAERRRIEEKREALRQTELHRQQKEAGEWHALIQRYLAAAVAYCDGEYAPGLDQPIMGVADDMYESSLWHRGFECLKDNAFYGWHRVLPVLLSIRYNRPVGYHKYHSAYQVLEAGVRQTVRAKNRGFAVMYLWASYIYKPTMNPKQRQWREDLVEEMKRSITAGDTTFRRVTYYDEAVGMLFSEMNEKLCRPFATEHDGRETANQLSHRPSDPTASTAR